MCAVLQFVLHHGTGAETAATQTSLTAFLLDCASDADAYLPADTGSTVTMGAPASSSRLASNSAAPTGGLLTTLIGSELSSLFRPSTTPASVGSQSSLSSSSRQRAIALFPCAAAADAAVSRLDWRHPLLGDLLASCELVPRFVATRVFSLHCSQVCLYPPPLPPSLSLSSLVIDRRCNYVSFFAAAGASVRVQLSAGGARAS